MDKLRLRLLGTFQVGDTPGISLRRKNRAILAYLALSSQPVSRQTLANLFCQSAADPAHTLRLSLSRLRRALGKAALITEGDTAHVNKDYFQTDLFPFQQLLERSDLPDLPLETLQEVVDLYQGNFLEGLHLPDAPEFEMWLVGQQGYWRQLYERGALILLKRLTVESQYPTALQTAHRLVQQNPLLEEAHYHLIWLYAQTDQRTAALEQYKQCQTILNDELAVEPTQELQTLYEDVLAGRLIHSAPILTPLPTPLTAVSAVDFVGREAEWQELDKAWQAVQQGNQRTLLVTAEAGGGKTRLIQEWAANLPAGAFLHSPCYETAQTLAYHPWQPVLEQLYNQLNPKAVEKLSPPSLNALARLIPALAHHHPLSGSGRQDQLLLAVHDLLQLMNQPLVLFLDDWQWADPATLRLLHFLIVQRTTPHLIIGAYRSEEVTDNPALLTLLQDWGRAEEEIVTLTLAPFSAESVAQLIEQLWPKLPAGYRAPHLRDSLTQATGGNPLFVNEIIRELAGSAQIPKRLPVPPSLRDLIQRRLRALPSSGRQVLESLAILNQPAQFDLIRQISGRSEDEALTALEHGLQRRLLATTTDTPSQVSFSHDLMSQAVRENVSPLRAQVLHRRTAVTLAQHEAKAARLAYHWNKAGNQEQERIYATKAGHQSAALYAHQEAITYWQRALALNPDTDLRLELSYHLGRSYYSLAEWAEAEKMYQTGLELSGDEANPIKADIQAAYGLLLENKGDYPASQAMVEQALAYFRSVNNRPQLARTQGLIALLHLRQARYDEAFQTTQQALADPEATIDPITYMRLINIRGLVHWRRQAFEQAFEDFQQALQLAQYHQERLYHALILNNLGNISLERGQYDQSINHYRLALELNQEINNQVGVSMNLGNLALTHFYKGNDEMALSYGHKALEMSREMGSQTSVSLYLNNLANSLVRLERYEESFDYLQEALEIDAHSGNPRGVLIDAGNLSSLYLLWGNTAEALICLTYALHQDERLEHTRELARHLIDIAAVYLFDEQLTQAEAILQMAMPLQNKLAIDFEQCWAFLVQGRLLLAQAQYTAAVETLQKAQQLAQTANRTDIEFEAAVRLPRAQWLAGQIEASTAVQQYESLDQTNLTPLQQAAVYYQQWHISKNKTYQAKARQAYQTQLQQTYTAEAHQRAQELGATNLPKKTAVPPVPKTITASPLDLEAILKTVAAQIPTL